MILSANLRGFHGRDSSNLSSPLSMLYIPYSVTSIKSCEDRLFLNTHTRSQFSTVDTAYTVRPTNGQCGPPLDQLPTIPALATIGYIV